MYLYEVSTSSVYESKFDSEIFEKKFLLLFSLSMLAIPGKTKAYAQGLIKPDS